MRWRDIVELKMAKISSLFPVSIFNDLLFNILGSFPRPMSGRRRHPVQVGWNVSVKCAIYFPRRVNVGHDRRHPQRPIGGDESLQGRSPAAQRALRAQRERQAAPEERDGRLPQRLLPGNAKTLEKRNARPPGPAKIKGTMLPSEPSAGGRPGRTPGARLPCRRGRATGGRVPSLETFLHRDAPHPAGHFLPRAGERDASPPFPKDQRPAVRRPAGLAFYAGGVGAGVSAQGREPSVRQMALLSFRDAVVLQLPLEDSLANGGANGGGAPPDLTHMLLVLQGVRERGPSSDQRYRRLERLAAAVVSPYLADVDSGQLPPSECTGVGGSGSQPDVVSSLTPLLEHEGEAYLEKVGAARRHTVANAHPDVDGI
ncbi:uncharacterized protein prr5l isoform X3 [Stigmatopora nigra]